MKKVSNLTAQESMEELKNRLIEAEETIEAIKYNKVDALLISTKKGEQVWTLSDSELPYRVLIEQMNEGAVTVSNDGTIIFSNNKFADLLKVSFEHIIGSSIFKWAAISDLNCLTSFLRENLENSKIELNLLRGDGTLVPVSLLFTRLSVDEDDSIICLTITDLTERKKNEEIFASEKLARSVIEQASDAIIVCDENKIIIRASRGAEQLAGEKLLNIPFNSVFAFEDGKKDKVLLDDILNDPLPASEEVLFRRKNGEAFNLIFNLDILSGTEDKIIGYIIILTNITTYIQAEEKINASLKEKTILLKEIHHRIKNNLQMISSLLNIQSSNIKDPDIQGIFLECQQRIRSMARIHRKLYETKSFSAIFLDDYIKDSVIDLCNAYRFSPDRVVMNFPADKKSISINSAVPLGLIMNELITNCFKHALSKKPDDELIITIAENSVETFTISVKDNGKGFPENIDYKNTETLGLQLILSLVEQLNGSIELIRNNGTEFKITLPLE